MDNTSDFNGPEFQPNNTTVTDSKENEEMPVQPYPWNFDHSKVMNMANIDYSDSRFEESTSYADSTILGGLGFPSPNASHNISNMSSASIFVGPPMVASTPAVKHASLLDPPASVRVTRTLKRKCPVVSPIRGGSSRMHIKRKATTSTTDIHGGHELADPEDASAEHGEPKLDEGEQVTNDANKNLSIVLEEHSDSSLDNDDKLGGN